MEKYLKGIYCIGAYAIENPTLEELENEKKELEETIKTLHEDYEEEERLKEEIEYVNMLISELEIL